MKDLKPEDMPKAFYRVSAKALILNEARDSFLICKEDNGRYDLPGGGIDSGESAKDCIEREIKEEMGLEVTFVAKDPLFHIFSTSMTGFDCINFLYETKVKDYNLTPSEECIEIVWLNKENVSQYDVFPNVKKILEGFQKYIH